MGTRLLRRSRGSLLTITFTDSSDGDLAVDSSEVAARRAAIDRRPWTWLRQVHSADVVIVTRPGEHAGSSADAAVADVDNAVLAVQGADCAPIVFWSPEGPFGVAHAGWRGIERGVIQSSVDALRRLGAGSVFASVGPCIHPDRYQFGVSDLARLEQQYGPSVIGETRCGDPALDVPEMIRVALTDSGAKMDHDVDVCTGASLRHFSHRVRSDAGRHCGVVVRESNSSS